MTDEEIKELIRRRRYQMLVSSYIYYELDENILTDNEWMRRSHELYDLQQKYPELAKKVIYAKEFADWTGDSGHHLKYGPEIISTSTRLLKEIQRRRTEE